jgi:hypothetical protein
LKSLQYVDIKLIIWNKVAHSQPRKPVTNFHNFREVLEAFPAISSVLSAKLEQDIQSFCDRAIEAKNLTSMHDDMKELLQKEYQVCPCQLSKFWRTESNRKIVKSCWRVWIHWLYKSSWIPVKLLQNHCIKYMKGRMAFFSMCI